MSMDFQESFLCPLEKNKLAGMRSPKRREEWLLGRWTAKNLLRGCKPEFHGLNLDEIEISNTESGAPVLRFPGCELFHANLSISHSNRHAFCTLNFNPEISVGADLEIIETRFPGLVAEYFTREEAELIEKKSALEQDILTNLFWSAKEAMLKSLNLGLRLDTRKIEIISVEGLGSENNAQTPWFHLQVRSYLPVKWRWAAWWQKRREFVMTISAASTIFDIPEDLPLIEVPVFNTPLSFIPAFIL